MSRPTIDGGADPPGSPSPIEEIDRALAALGVLFLCWPLLLGVLGGAWERAEPPWEARLSPEARALLREASAGIEPGAGFDVHVHLAGIAREEEEGHGADDGVARAVVLVLARDPGRAPAWRGPGGPRQCERHRLLRRPQ